MAQMSFRVTEFPTTLDYWGAGWWSTPTKREQFIGALRPADTLVLDIPPGQAVTIQIDGYKPDQSELTQDYMIPNFVGLAGQVYVFSFLTKRLTQVLPPPPTLQDQVSALVGAGITVAGLSMVGIAVGEMGKALRKQI